MKSISFILWIPIIASGCIGIFTPPSTTLNEVEFEGASFGLEYIPDPSLEGYNETYHVFYQPRGTSKRKYILKNESGFHFDYFPGEASLLRNIPVTIIDTVRRTYEKYGPTEDLTTLYLDPNSFDQKSFDTFVRFVKQSYQRPDTANQFLLWMNKHYNLADKPDTLHFLNTIYAIVYSDIDKLEPVYSRADGKAKLKIGVDRIVYFEDLTEQHPGWMARGSLKDSVLTIWQGYEKDTKNFGEYASGGNKFGALYQRIELRP